MAIAEQIEQERHVIEDVVRSVERPRGVSEPNFTYVPDHSGEEAVYITYVVNRKVPLTKARARELAGLTMRTLESLHRPDIELVPYVKYSETR